jgi:hypothetical protein
MNNQDRKAKLEAGKKLHDKLDQLGIPRIWDHYPLSLAQRLTMRDNAIR